MNLILTSLALIQLLYLISSYTALIFGGFKWDRSSTVAIGTFLNNYELKEKHRPYNLYHNFIYVSQLKFTLIQ